METCDHKKSCRSEIKKNPAGLEPATFRVLGGRDDHYTTETIHDGQ